MVQAEVEKFQSAAEEVASFLKARLSRDIRIKINTHTDPDGVAAGNILARCFNYYDVPFHISFGGPPNSEDIEKLREQDYDLYAFLDQGTGQFKLIEEYLLEADREVLILDHHPGEIENRPKLAFLNPHSFGLNGAKDVSASGVVYSVVEKIDKKFKPLSEMVLIGALGDRQDLISGFTGVNEDLVKRAIDEDLLIAREGLKLNGRTSPAVECLRLSVRPFLPGLSGEEKASRELIEDVGLDPNKILEEFDSEDEKKLKDEILNRIEITSNKDLKHSLWGTIYTPQVRQAVGPKNVHEYVTMLDACEKLGKIGVGFSALLGDENSREEALKTLHEYQKKIIEIMNWLLSNKERIKSTPQMRYVDVEDKLESNMIGEVLSIAIESGLVKTDRPILGLTKSGEDKLKVSARATPEYATSGANIGEVLKKVSEELEGRGGGHDVAAAARLPLERKDEFLKKVGHLIKETS